MAIRENSWRINNQGMAFGQVRTRIDTDYTDLHELSLPVFVAIRENSWIINNQGMAFGQGENTN